MYRNNSDHAYLYGDVPSGPLQDQQMYKDLMMKYNYYVSSGNSQGGSGKTFDSIKDFIGNLVVSGAKKYFTRTSGRGQSGGTFTVNDARDLYGDSKEAFKKLSLFMKLMEMAEKKVKAKNNWQGKGQSGKGFVSKTPIDNNNYNNVMRKTNVGISY